MQCDSARRLPDGFDSKAFSDPRLNSEDVHANMVFAALKIFNYSRMFFVSALFRHNSHTIQFTRLKGYGSWFLVYPRAVQSPPPTLGHFYHPKRNYIRNPSVLPSLTNTNLFSAS